MGKKKSEDGKVNKAEAVRVALAEGKESPEEGVEFIKERYGIDLPKAIFSSYKSIEKAKAAKKAVNAEDGGHGVSIKPVSRKTKISNGHAAELARAVKQLVALYGPDEVKGMVGVFTE